MIIRSRAPVRISFAGGGTDVSPYCEEHGGFAVNATINKYVYGEYRPTDESILEDLKLNKKIDLKNYNYGTS